MHHTPSMSYGSPSSNYGSPSSSYGTPTFSTNSIQGNYGNKILGSGKQFGGSSSFGGNGFGKGPRGSSFGGYSFGGQKGFGSFKGGNQGFGSGGLGNSLSGGHGFGGNFKGFGTSGGFKSGSFSSGGSLSGGHSFGGGNSFGSGFKTPSFGGHNFGGNLNLKGGNFGSFGGGLKGGLSFGGGQSSFPSSGYSFGPNFGGSFKGGNVQPVVHMQVMNNPFVTGVGLSGNYDSRTLSLGDSFSGSGKGYQLGSLGNGQSPQFDFTGKNLEQVPSGHLGTQKLHTMVSFSSLEPHTPSTSYGQPQESYGAPTESDSNSFNVGHQSVQQTYGTPDFVGSQGAISSVMIQSGDKQGPVMFYGGTPTPNSLSGTFITMANNPSNSYGVPMYAQSSGSQSGHQPSFSVGGHTNQLFASYTTGGGQSQHQPESSYGAPQISYTSHQEESSASYLPPSSSYGAPTASASTSYEAPSVSYGAPNTKIPFKPSPFIGATSPLSYKESNRDLNAYSTQISHNYEAAGGSSYDAPVYNTISYSMPSSLDTQYTQTH